MPRKYYRRKYSYRPRRKWNSNWNSETTTLYMPDISTVDAYTEALSHRQLIINPQQTGTNVSTSIVKVKNVKVHLSTTGIPDASDLNVYTMEVFIIFCPEGIIPNIGLIAKHPEWLMAYKLMTIDASTTIPINFSISSRLARNLNSGDAIYLVTIVRRTSAEQATENRTGLVIPCYYTVQYWTCVN